nr:hypothetical protein [Tanacetum cinerariifolium]
YECSVRICNLTVLDPFRLHRRLHLLQLVHRQL